MKKNFDITDRLAAIMEDILNRRMSTTPYTERPLDWLPDAAYEIFLDLVYEEFELERGDIQDVESLTFEELADEIERLLKNS
jgi:hypothetical protein